MYVIGSQRELPSLLPSLLLMMIGFIIIIVSYRIASYHLLPLSRSLSVSLSLPCDDNSFQQQSSPPVRHAEPDETAATKEI